MSGKETHKGGNYSVNSTKEDNNSQVSEEKREGDIAPSMIQRKELDLPDYKAKAVEV